MSEHHEIIEKDKAYLEEVGVRSLLQQFVADAIDDHPENVYEYMATWAARKGASQAAENEEGDHQATGAYPSEEALKEAARSSDYASEPNPALHRHEKASEDGRPVEEV